MNRYRWGLLAGAVLLVALVFAYLLFSAAKTIRSTQTTEPGPARVSQDAAAKAGPADDDPSMRPGFGVGRLDVPLGSGAGERGTAPSLGELAAKDYHLRARLPESTQPLDGGYDPIADADAVSPHRATGPDGEEPVLVAFPAAVNFEAPEPVVVRAYFTFDGAPEAAESLTVRLINERLGTVASIEMNDDGRDGDEIAGDLVYGAQFQPPDESMVEYRGTYVAAVRGSSTRLEERAVSTGFLYSVPSARPTGRFRDVLAEGNLRLEIELEVFVAGRFHAEAVLAAADGQLLAWAQNAARFGPGMHWLPVEFYGLVLRESGVDGPYVLKSLAVATVGEMPNQKNRVLKNAHTTSPYRATDFTDEPYEDPDMNDAARRAAGDGPVAPEAGPEP